jgi:carbamoyl-phosphate synthase large subunit
MFTILFTAIGRRVELVKAFQASFTGKKIKARIIGVDTNPHMASAGYFTDAVFTIPRVSEAGYVEELQAICTQQNVDMLIPLFEPEFVILDENRHRFLDRGTTIVLSDRKVIDICGDKYKTYLFLQECKLKTPRTFLPTGSLENENFPLFVKPRSGMGSHGVQKVEAAHQLANALRFSNDMLIQEYIAGTEYTIDTLVDFAGQAVSIVPRERLEVRSGEVSKSRTVDRPDLIEQCKYIVEQLGAIGPLTLQCIDTGTDVYWIEINPRFGGGVPLSIAAGIDYPMLLYRMWKREKIQPFLGQYKKGLMMLRYDKAVYI